MNNEIVWVNEGFVLSDAGHLIGTSYVDLRKPEDRAPIESLVRGCERKYALEDCETLIISQPARYRSFGEELIRDHQEGSAREESVIVSQGTQAEATRQRAASDLNQALALTISRMRPSYSESNNNIKKSTQRIAYAKEWWIFCASIKPDANEWPNSRNALSKDFRSQEL